MKKRIFSFLLALSIGVLLLSGCSFSGSDPSAPSSSTSGQTETHSYNPLTGLEVGSDFPADQRPVAIMINNAQPALPQTGIASADVIYEMETEWGVTRMMAVYSDYTKVPLVGPVRSARDQFVQFLLPLNAVFVHIGGSIYATDMLNYYQYQDIDGLYLGLTSFVFDEDRYQTKAQEHCWYTNASLIQQGIDAVSLPTTGAPDPLFDFGAPDAPTAGGTELAFDFSDYGDAAFRYDPDTGLYLKSIYGAPQIDEGTGEQLSFTNLFLLFTEVTNKEDSVLTNFDLSSGEGYYFNGGGYRKIRWEKGNPDSPLKLYDENGDSLKVAPGKSYIAVVSTARLSSLTVDGSALVPALSEES